MERARFTQNTSHTLPEREDGKIERREQMMRKGGGNPFSIETNNSYNISHPLSDCQALYGTPSGPTEQSQSLLIRLEKARKDILLQPLKSMGT